MTSGMAVARRTLSILNRSRFGFVSDESFSLVEVVPECQTRVSRLFEYEPIEVIIKVPAQNWAGSRSRLRRSKTIARLPIKPAVGARRPLEGRLVSSSKASRPTRFGDLGDPGFSRRGFSWSRFRARARVPPLVFVARRDLGRKRVIQRRFNVAVPRARVPKKDVHGRDRSER